MTIKNDWLDIADRETLLRQRLYYARWKAMVLSALRKELDVITPMSGREINQLMQWAKEKIEVR